MADLTPLIRNIRGSAADAARHSLAFRAAGTIGDHDPADVVADLLASQAEYLRTIADALERAQRGG